MSPANVSEPLKKIKNRLANIAPIILAKSIMKTPERAAKTTERNILFCFNTPAANPIKMLVGAKRMTEGPHISAQIK